MVGKYVLHGQILIIPVRGNGAANVTISKNLKAFRQKKKSYFEIVTVNPDIHLKFTGKPSNIEGKTYMQTEDMKVTFSVDK